VLEASKPVDGDDASKLEGRERGAAESSFCGFTYGAGLSKPCDVFIEG